MGRPNLASRRPASGRTLSLAGLVAVASAVALTVASAVVSAITAPSALAQPAAPAAPAWPVKPVRIIVPFASGGPADNYARFIGERLQTALGQPVIIDDRPGAGSMIGTDAAAKAPADGYTLLLVSNAQTVNESLLPSRPYSLLRDFVPVTPINYSDLVLVVRNGLPVRTLADLIRLAKAQPGKLNYASSGPGTPYHMAGELFKHLASVDIVHVPYKGSSGARTDVIGGQVDMMFDAVTTMSEFVRSGKVKALATTGRSRSAVMADVPTVAEAGVPGYDATIWLGLLAPRGTPASIVARLHDAVAKITATAEVRQNFARQGAVPMTMSQAEFVNFVRNDVAKWERVVKLAGIKAE